MWNIMKLALWWLLNECVSLMRFSLGPSGLTKIPSILPSIVA